MNTISISIINIITHKTYHTSCNWVPNISQQMALRRASAREVRYVTEATVYFFSLLHTESQNTHKITEILMKKNYPRVAIRLLEIFS